MSDSGVNDGAPTHESSKQPQESKSASDLAVSKLKELAAAGTDFVNNPMSRKDADRLAIEFNKEHGTNIKGGVFYKARSMIRSGKLKEIENVVNDNIGGKVKMPEDLFDMEGAQKVEDIVNGGKGEQKQEINDSDLKPDKKPEPIPIENLTSIIDVCVEGVADTYKGVGIDVNPAGVRAAKTTYNQTARAYNAEIPRWVLIPLCIGVTFFVFVLPVLAKAASKPKTQVPEPERPQSAGTPIEIANDELEEAHGGDPFMGSVQ